MIRTSSGRLAAHIRTAIVGISSNSSNGNTNGSNPIAFVQRQQSTIQNQNQSPQSLNETDKYSFYSPTEGFIRRSIYETIKIPNVTLDQYVWSDIHKWRNKVATVCVVTGRQYTYAELYDSTIALAIRFQHNFKLQPRDVIAVCLPNVPEYPIAVFGGIQAGLVITTVNPAYTAEEIARQISSSNSKLIIGTAHCYATLKEACNIAKRNIPIVCIRTSKNDTIPSGAIDFFELINTKSVNFSDLKSTDVTINDMSFLPYSSGTTGLPKGVCLSHRNVTSNCEMLERNQPFPSMVEETTETYQDVSPSILPFFHIYGLTVCMISKLKLGVKIVTLPKFTPDDMIKSLYDYKGTILNLVPPIVLFLTNHPKVEQKHVEKLRLVFSGAAPIGTLDVEKFKSKYPNIDFVQGYGLTETSPVIIMGHQGCQKYASVGFPTASTEAKIVEFNDSKCLGVGPNQTGEVWVRGPQVMQGYLNNEEATRDMLVDGGWLKTGDVGHYDEQGYFYITDRMKELIKVKGFQVPPAELEEILRDHPKVLDAAVIGIPHDHFGEVPRAFIVLRDKIQATEKEIQDFVAGKVAVYKKLEGGVQFLDEIPKTASGKILRRDLKQKFS